MTLAALIRGQVISRAAPATPATPATSSTQFQPAVATVATVAVAKKPEDMALTYTERAAQAMRPTALITEIRDHKTEIVVILSVLDYSLPEWTSTEWLAFYDERAGIAEFDGGLIHAQAEARAFDCCVIEWINRNPVQSQPGHCLECSRCEHTHDPLLPFGGQTYGHAWLHSRCWPAWYAGREAEAVVTLKTMGIVLHPNFPDDLVKTEALD
jgi:hypothetical protein